MKGARNITSEICFPLRRERGAIGFTLIELLVVISIIAILATVGLGVAQAAIASARQTKETNAARNLVAALLASAGDGDGVYLAGMDMRKNASSNPVYKPNGQIVTNSRAAQRYPFRIAPYLSNDFNGTILVNKNLEKIQQVAGSSGSNFDYYVSTYPALGMNIYCVGGVVASNGNALFNSECITGPARLRRSILAFASAGSGKGADKIEGYCYVTPPTLANDSPACAQWGSNTAWNRNSDPLDFGNVDFRYKSRAVCAFLDGSARMCTVRELNDMRLWNMNAADQDNATYSLAP